MLLASTPSLQPRPSASRNRLPAGARPRSGATAVEFAVVASVYFMLILGVIEFGRAFMAVELLNEAARRGCRLAIIEGTSSDQIRKASTDFLTSVGINGETAGVIINDLPSNTVEAKYMPAYTEMTVQVTVPVSSVTWVPNAIFPTGSLTGQFTMRRE